MTRLLYAVARLLRDLDALLSCDPARWLRRCKNKLVGRRLNKLWRWP